MAVTQATTLADFTSGIGTAGAVFQVDNANNRIGIGTTNPQSLLDVDGNADIAGIATITALYVPGGSYSAVTDTKTDAAIVIQEDTSIYTQDGTQYLRTLIEKKSDTINIGQHNTALIDAIELKPGSGQVKLHHGGNSDNVKFQTTGIGVSVSNGAASTATIAAPANLVIDPAVVGDNTGLVRIKGNLFVDGTTTQINSTTLEISDFIVGIASTATTDLLTDGAGIKIGPDNTFLYEHNGGTNSSLKSSENLNVASGKVYQIGETERLSADTLSVGTGATVHSPSSDTLTLGTNGDEALRIISDGKLLAGHTESRDVFKETRVQISGANGDDAGLSIYSTESGTAAPNLILGHSRNGAAVDDGDILGDITFVGHDGTDLNSRASIIRSIMTADGTNNSLYADLVFYTNRNSGGYPEESLRITSAGDLLINHDSSDGSGKLQVFTGSQDGIDILGFSNTDTAGGRLTFYRSKSNTVGNFSEVADGDSLGRIDWRGYNDDGTANNLGATIEALVSGDVDSTTDMPSDLVFKTSPNGSSSPTERVRITSDGKIGIGNTISSALLTIGGDSNEVTTPSIRLLDGTDSREVSITNTAGDFVVSTHGTDDATHGRIKIFESGIIALDNGGASGTIGTRLKILADGNIGINQDTPNKAKLHVVSGGNDVEEIVAKFRNSYSTAGSAIAKIGLVAGYSDTANNTEGHAYIGAARGGNGNTSSLIFETYNGSSIGERLRIASDGKVGIGTNNPATNLDVDGSLQLRASGNYTTYATRIYSRLDSTHCSVIESYLNNSTAFEMMGSYADSGGTNPRIVLGAGGKPVGINTTIPQAQLHVAGTIYQTVIEYPTIRPTLDLNFATTKVLDDRITFTRDSLATYYGEDGLLKYASNNVPRFDHDPDTRESLGLLLEYSSTNLISGSGGYGSDIRGGTNLGNAPTTAVVDGITLPDGTVGQVRRLQIHSSGNSGMRWGSTGGGNVNTAYSASVWARAVSGTANFSIDTNDQGNVSYNLTEEWVRMEVTGTTSEGAYQFMDLVGSANANGYFWGFQLENKPFVSSYIPVASNESSKTRAQDTAKITGSNFTDFYNQNESTLFVNYKLDKNNYLESPAGVDMVTFRTDGNSHGYDIRIVTDTSTPTLDAHGVHNSVAQYDLAGISLSSGFKDYFIAKAFKLNDVAVSFNGATPQTDTTAAVVERDTLYIGYVPRRAHYKSIKYFNKRLPNAQLQGLTHQ